MLLYNKWICLVLMVFLKAYSTESADSTIMAAIIPQGFTFANIGHLNPSDLLQATMAHNLEEVTIMSIGQSDGHLPSNGQSDGHSAKLHGNSVFQKHHYKEDQQDHKPLTVPAGHASSEALAAQLARIEELINRAHVAEEVINLKKVVMKIKERILDQKREIAAKNLVELQTKAELAIAKLESARADEMDGGKTNSLLHRDELIEKRIQISITKASEEITSLRAHQLEAQKSQKALDDIKDKYGHQAQHIVQDLQTEKEKLDIAREEAAKEAAKKQKTDNGVNNVRIHSVEENINLIAHSLGETGLGGQALKKAVIAEDPNNLLSRNQIALDQAESESLSKAILADVVRRKRRATKIDDTDQPTDSSAHNSIDDYSFWGLVSAVAITIGVLGLLGKGLYVLYLKKRDHEINLPLYDENRRKKAWISRRRRNNTPLNSEWDMRTGILIPDSPAVHNYKKVVICNDPKINELAPITCKIARARLVLGCTVEQLAWEKARDERLAKEKVEREQEKIKKQKAYMVHRAEFMALPPAIPVICKDCYGNRVEPTVFKAKPVVMKPTPQQMKQLPQLEQSTSQVLEATLKGWWSSIWQ